MSKRDRERLLALALVLLAVLLIAGGVLYYRNTAGIARQQFRDTLHTQQAEAALEGRLTRAAQ